MFLITGFGDACQFTSVIKHIKANVPNVQIDIVCGYGKHSCFHGLVDNVFTSQVGSSSYDQVFNHVWSENYNSYVDYPATKTVKCIAETLKLITYEDLLTYTINIGQEAKNKVKQYLSSLPSKKGYVTIHYEGNTATGDKNISHDKIKLLCGFLIKNNYIPIILDWDNRSHLPDQSTIFCPNTKDSLWGGNGTGDAEIIAALIDQCVLFIGVDSGPLHVAMSTKTPTIGLWTKHHPIHYADFSNNTIHLIPKNHTN